MAAIAQRKRSLKAVYGLPTVARSARPYDGAQLVGLAKAGLLARGREPIQYWLRIVLGAD